MIQQLFISWACYVATRAQKFTCVHTSHFALHAEFHYEAVFVSSWIWHPMSEFRVGLKINHCCGVFHSILSDMIFQFLIIFFFLTCLHIQSSLQSDLNWCNWIPIFWYMDGLQLWIFPLCGVSVYKSFYNSLKCWLHCHIFTNEATLIYIHNWSIVLPSGQALHG